MKKRILNLLLVAFVFTTTLLAQNMSIGGAEIEKKPAKH